MHDKNQIARKQNIKVVIKSEIEQVFRMRVVTLQGFIELSNDVYYKTSCQLNVNRLRKFYNLVRGAYTAAQSTISILSRHFGFQSSHDLINIKRSNIEQFSMVKPESLLHHFVFMFNIEVQDAKLYLQMV